MYTFPSIIQQTEQGSMLDEVLFNAKALTGFAQAAASQTSTRANATADHVAGEIAVPSSTDMQDMALWLMLGEALLCVSYWIYRWLSRPAGNPKRSLHNNSNNLADKASGPPGSILRERVAERLAFERSNIGDVSSQVTAVGYGSTLKREASLGRNRRRGQSGSGHGLARDVYS
jgi:hypothetical protein